jgi:hypothetical protein
MILRVVLYGSETWFHTVFQKGVLRRMFRPKREEVAGSWRRLHNKELYNLYAAPNTRIIKVIKSKRMRLAGLVAHMVELSTVYNILVGKT